MTSTTATNVSAAQCLIGVPQIKENQWIQEQTGGHLTKFIGPMMAVRLKRFMEARRKGTARAIRRATEAANMGLQGMGCRSAMMVLSSSICFRVTTIRSANCGISIRHLRISFRNIDFRFMHMILRLLTMVHGLLFVLTRNICFFAQCK